MGGLSFRRRALKVVFIVMMAVVLIYTLFPFYWAVNTSLMPTEDLAKTPPDYVPTPPQLDSYIQVLKNKSFLMGLWNSIIVASGTTILSLFIGATSACALGRFRFVGRGPLMYIILAMTMFPQIAVVGAIYEMITKVGLYNTRMALILANLLTTLPFTVWVLTSFFRALPKELEEAAYVDGATPIQTFIKVLFPLSAPGLVTTGILAFIQSWNEYLFALTFTIDDSARTIPVVIAQFTGGFQYEVPWGQLLAGSILATGPLIILVLIFQGRLISGMTAGAVKG